MTTARAGLADRRPHRSFSLVRLLAVAEKSPSPPFRGEREGPRRGRAWEGEVGGVAHWARRPPPPFPPPPAGGGRRYKEGSSRVWLAGSERLDFFLETGVSRGEFISPPPHRGRRRQTRASAPAPRLPLVPRQGASPHRGRAVSSPVAAE